MSPTKLSKESHILGHTLLDDVFIMLIIVKIPTIVGILTFISTIKIDAKLS